MSPKVLFSSLIIGGGSIVAGGYGIYSATTFLFNPLKMAEKVVETTKSLKEIFKDLKEAKKKFLDSLPEEPKWLTTELKDKLGQDKETSLSVVVKKINEQNIQTLFKNIFLSKALENLLLQELSGEIKTDMEDYKSNKVEKDYEYFKNSWASTDELIKVIDLAKKFASQVISLYGELPSLFKDQENLFGDIKLEGNENPLVKPSYSPSLMSIPEKILSLEGDRNSEQGNVGNSLAEDSNLNKDKIEDNIFYLKISGTPVLDSEEFVEILKKDDIFEVTTEQDDDSQKIKTLTLKLKKLEEEKSENMWTYFGFTNLDLKEWKEMVAYKKSQEIKPNPEAK